MKNGAQLAFWDVEEDRIARLSDRTHSGRYTLLSAEKLRGGYYTSAEVARWICAWAVRSQEDCVLEPSCGDGVFVAAAANRLRELGATCAEARQRVTGIEIVEEEAKKARERLGKALGGKHADCVESADFFAWREERARKPFDAVVGNPPFIRYQTFPEPSRALAMAMMRKAGLAPNKLTNIWVPFVVAACACLKPGGRLGLVLPAELLQVSYASQLRSFLVQPFRAG